MNYMEQIAEMLGVKLYEDFRIKAINEMIFEKKFFLTEYGLFSEDSTVPISTILNDILNGQYKIVKLPFALTKEEKDYLSEVIKPFRDKIEYIKRLTFDSVDSIQVITEKGVTAVLFFETDTRYKNMEPDREYTLQELGLYVDKKSR